MPGSSAVKPGIGKATLAYRMARFVLAHPDPAAADVQTAQTLFVPVDNAVARRIASQAHSDLLVLERTVNDAGKMRTEIAVDDVRRTVSFFGSTAGEGGWRVCIVDSADELNRAGANTLLKILEEPPARALLIVVSHTPGRLLPTIRSRCRRLTLRPLAEADLIAAAAQAIGVARLTIRNYCAPPSLPRAVSIVRLRFMMARCWRCASGSRICWQDCRKRTHRRCMPLATALAGLTMAR